MSLEEFRSDIISDKYIVPSEYDDVILDRFLTANKGNVKKALDQLKRTVQWRRENVQGQASMQERVPPYNDYFGDKLYQAFHGVDKRGRPIIIERMGHIPYDQILAEVPAEHLYQRHIWQMEELDRRCKEMAAKSGSDIHQFILILDTKDFKIQMNNKKLEMFKAVLKIDADYYPETLGQIFIINAPMVFRSIWAVVSNFVDKKTRTKINFIGSDNRKLLEFVDASQLPIEFGGCCNKCRPGYRCVPDIGEPYIESFMNIDGSLRNVKKVKEEVDREASPAASEVVDAVKISEKLSVDAILPNVKNTT
jgi:hypothetical protein